MAKGLEFRAAEYFGMQGEPRTSVRIGRFACIIVRGRAYERTGFALYDESIKPKGQYISLTDKQREKLQAALTLEAP